LGECRGGWSGARDYRRASNEWCVGRLGSASILLRSPWTAGASSHYLWRQLLPFALFFFYGGLLEILLTAAFWEWSGLASLGVFAAAISTLPAVYVAAALMRRRATLMPSQRRMALATAAYPIITVLFFVVGRALAQPAAR